MREPNKEKTRKINVFVAEHFNGIRIKEGYVGDLIASGIELDCFLRFLRAKCKFREPTTAEEERAEDSRPNWVGDDFIFAHLAGCQDVFVCDVSIPNRRLEVPMEANQSDRNLARCERLTGSKVHLYEPASAVYGLLLKNASVPAFLKAALVQDTPDVDEGCSVA
jgi:hypothetical protein